MAYNITPILRICCMLLLWLVLFPLYANADWLKVESDNFVMIGDADKSESVRLVAELEVFRQTLVQLAGASRPSEIRKIHIYASRKRRTFNPYTRVRSELIASWYEAKDDNPTIAIYWRGNGKRLRERAFFEVSRHLLHALSIDFIPYWYETGLAYYFARSKIDGNIVTIGLLPDSHMSTILNFDVWRNARDSLNSITKPAVDIDTVIQATGYWRIQNVYWVAAHYIRSSPEVSEGFGDYVNLLRRGVDPTRAFEEAFGIGQEEFVRRLQDYWRAHGLPYEEFRAVSSVDEIRMTTSILHDGDVEPTLARSMVSLLPDGSGGQKRRRDARRKIRQLIEKHGASVLLYRALSMVERKDGNYDEAVALGETAYALAPDDPLAIQTLADALNYRYCDGGRKISEDLARARALFRRQLALEPTNPTANARYPATFLFDDTLPDARAIEATGFNLEYRRNPANFDTYLDTAEVLLEAGYPDEACVSLDVIRVWVRLADAELADRDRDEFARSGRETHLERLERVEDELGDACRYTSSWQDDPISSISAGIGVLTR